jgi:hypothetical protein
MAADAPARRICIGRCAFAARSETPKSIGANQAFFFEATPEEADAVGKHVATGLMWEGVTSVPTWTVTWDETRAAWVALLDADNDLSVTIGEFYHLTDNLVESALTAARLGTVVSALYVRRMTVSWLAVVALVAQL